MPNFSPPSLHHAGLRAARWLLALVLLLALPAARLHAQVLARTFAASSSHSLSIHADGTLWATGNNQYGQLGQPSSTASSTTWVQVGTATNWVQVAAGFSYSLGLRADGSLWAWGSNQYGELGNPTNNGTSTPTPTPTQVAGTYIQLAAGASHSLALRADGSLWAWGLNYDGQLGSTTNTGTLNANPTPTQVAGTYTQVAAGGSHSLGLRADGSLWAWGANFFGQLGNPTNSNTYTATPTPTQVTGTYTQVTAGSNHSLGLRADGSLWAWGLNYDGQLGSTTNTGTATANPTPTQVAGIYTQVAAGTYHSLGLRADGSLWAWGQNQYGQLGTATNSGTATANPTPTQVAGTYAQVAAGQYHSLGLRADGTLTAWGYNLRGQLGTPTNSGTQTPNPTPTATGTALVTRSLAMGYLFGLAVKGDGTLWAWGLNLNGQLGIPTSTGRTNRPVQVGTAHDWVQVAAGFYYSLGLRADGSLWAWGSNQYGELGNPTGNGNQAAAHPTPTQVAGTYTQVAAGADHVLALRADGSLWAWGYNYNGELGNHTNNGTPNANPTPTQVAGTYTQVAAGGYHSLALRADGSLWAWGLNIFGQLGNGSTSTSATPTQVAGTYTQMTVGQDHSLALRADGSLWAWGDNIFGQLGNASNNSTATPTQVTGTYTQVAAGAHYSLGLRADGSLFTWGDNSFGQLGNGSSGTNSNTPTREISLGTGWTTLGTGSTVSFSLVRTASAQTFASAGYNGGGQLGDGTTTDAYRFDRLSPLLSLQPLPVLLATAAPGLHLFPNPAPAGATTLTGAAPGAPVTVLDALGRPVASATADASGTATLTLPAGLPAGVYLVRAGQHALRLALD